MGIRSASDVTYTFSNINTVVDLRAICVNVRNLNSNENITVDVDCNWVANKLKSETDTAIFLKILANAGFIVTPICDGHSRHHSKRASTHRIFNREKARIDAISTRCDYMKISQKLSCGNLTNIDKDPLHDEQKLLQKKMKKLESGAFVVSPDFACYLEEEFKDTEETDSGGRVEKVLIAKYQADSMLAQRAICQKSHIIVANDTDFLVLVGPECLLLRDFKIKRGIGNKRKEIKLAIIRGMSVACASMSTQKKISKGLEGSKNCNKIVKKDAKYPVFGIESIQLRAAAAVAIGCDVYIGGIKGLGPQKVYQMIKTLMKETNATIEFKKWVCQKNKMELKVFDALVSALLFEPATTSETAEDCFIHGIRPKYLPSYLKDFAETTVPSCPILPFQDDPHMCECVGPYSDSLAKHVFLKGEEEKIKTCAICKQIVCMTCRVDESETSSLCLPCYAISSNVDKKQQEKHLSTEEMREKLNERGYELDKQAKNYEVEEIYYEYIVEEALENARDGTKTVTFPLLPAKFMAENELKCSLGEAFSFSEGAAFLGDPKIASKIVPVLELFASFLEFKPKVKYTKYDHKIYEALPTLFVEIAHGSRRHSGFRLLRRCLRHTFDSRSKNLIETDARLILCENGEIGIMIENDIPASMKEKIYAAKAIFTKESLVCCSCTCHCGACEEEAVTCVHILPLGFQLALLLMDGLAENLILELLPLIRDGRAVVEEQDEMRMRKALYHLLVASSYPKAEEILHRDKKLFDVLQSFAVGTECFKQNNVPAPDPKMLSAISDLQTPRLRSTENMALEKMKRGKDESDCKTLRTKRYNFTPDYLRLSMLLEILKTEEHDLSPGFQLLMYRANHVKKRSSCQEISTLFAQLQKEWKVCQKDCESRSWNHLKKNRRQNKDNKLVTSLQTSQESTPIGSTPINLSKAGNDLMNDLIHVKPAPTPINLSMEENELLGHTSQTPTAIDLTMLEDEKVHINLPQILKVKPKYPHLEKDDTDSLCPYGLITSRCVEIFMTSLRHLADPSEVSIFDVHIYHDLYFHPKKEESWNYLKKRYFTDTLRRISRGSSRRSSQRKNIYKGSLHSPLCIFPIHIRGDKGSKTKSMADNARSTCIDHWALLLRENIGGDVNFFFLDSLNSVSNMNEVRETISGTDILPTSAQSSWKLIRTIDQIEYECGTRMCYHAYLATIHHLKSRGNRCELAYESVEVTERNATHQDSLKMSLARNVRAWFEKCVLERRLYSFHTIEEVPCYVPLITTPDGEEEEVGNILIVNGGGGINQSQNKENVFAGNISYTTPSKKNSAPKRGKRPVRKKYCCFHGCKSTSLTEGISFHRIQAIPKRPKENETSVEKWKTFHLKTKKRRLLLKACGLLSNDSRVDLRICEEHQFENQTFRNQEFKDGSGEVRGKHSFTLNVPLPIGVKNAPLTSSKGTGRDRQVVRILGDVEKASWEMVAQQTTSMILSNQKIPLNKRVAECADINHENKRRKNEKGKSAIIFKHERVKGCHRNAHLAKPRVCLETLNDKEVRLRTGFKSKKEMLAFIFVVHNGDLRRLREGRTTCMTWLEEWVFYFEMVKGKTIRLWEVAEHEDKGFALHQSCLRNVFDELCSRVLDCKSSWPLYARHEEDRFLVSDPKMLEDFAGTRPIYWDMTNFPIPKPSDADMQRLTYSKYYGMNCFKGGIGLQQCGWICVQDLWTGAVSDTMYQEKSGIFEQQDAFSKDDSPPPLEDEEKEVLPFTNIFDKGYRNRLAAWRAGRQLTLQPDFAQSDKKFRRKETLSSAAVAASRAANERAVKLAKTSEYLKSGLKQRQSFQRLQHIWLAYGFQLNFMYQAVC